MLDREVIESKLRFLREYLNDLKDYESISLRDYKTSKKDQRFEECYFDKDYLFKVISSDSSCSERSKA